MNCSHQRSTRHDERPCEIAEWIALGGVTATEVCRRCGADRTVHECGARVARTAWSNAPPWRVREGRAVLRSHGIEVVGIDDTDSWLVHVVAHGRPQILDLDDLRQRNDDIARAVLRVIAR